MNTFLSYATFAGRCTKELVVTTACATVDATIVSSKVFSIVLRATARKRAIAFAASEFARLDSPFCKVKGVQA